MSKENTPTLPPVEKTPTMLRIESEHGGRDIRLIIAELYEKLGAKTEVAKVLGIDQSLLFVWSMRLGITFENKPTAVISSRVTR